MVKKIDLRQVGKAAVVYGIISATTIETWLFLVNTSGVIDVNPQWFLRAPLLVWGVVGIPASIASAERFFATIYKKPDQIEARAVAHDTTNNGREIPFYSNGKRGSIFASTMQWAIGDKPQPIDKRKLSFYWKVPYGDSKITIGEAELTRFLELASKRGKHQFSRRYWTKKRRPPIPRPYYESYLKLLTTAGLVEGRQHGSSGFLVGNIKPHNAITFLKFESPYRVM